MGSALAAESDNREHSPTLPKQEERSSLVTVSRDSQQPHLPDRPIVRKQIQGQVSWSESAGHVAKHWHYLQHGPGEDQGQDSELKHSSQSKEGNAQQRFS